MARLDQFRDELGDVVAALKTNVRAINGIDRSLATTSAKLAATINPIATLTEAFRRQEAVSLQALSIGSSYNRFLAANTESIKGLKTSTIDLMEVMMTGFVQGLRGMSRDTLELADEMVMTGQNTGALTQAMAAMRFLTGNSVEVTSNLSKTLKTTQKDTGVSFEKLSNALSNLQSALFEASIYGSDAVEGLAKIGTTLTGSLASAPGADRAISTLIQALKPLNIAQQSLLGIQGFAERALNNDLSQAQINQEILTASKRLDKMLGTNDRQRQALSEAIGSQQVAAILRLGGMIENQINLSDKERADQATQLRTMREFEKKKMKFFTDLAPEIHSTVVKFLPALVALSTGFEATKFGTGQIGYGRRQLEAGKGVRGAARLAAGGLAVLGGPVGIIAGLAMAFGPTLLEAIQGGSDPEKKVAALAEEEARARRKASSSQDMNDYSTLVNIVSDVNRQALQRADSRQLTRAIEMLTEKIADLKPTQQSNAPVNQTKR